MPRKGSVLRTLLELLITFVLFAAMMTRWMLHGDYAAATFYLLLLGLAVWAFSPDKEG